MQILAFKFEKGPVQFFVGIGKQGMFAKFQHKLFNLNGSWGLSKFSFFQTNNLVSRK